MASWQLLVHNDGDILEQCEVALAGAANAKGRPAPVIRARNLREARQSLADWGAKSCKLVVVGAATPRDHASSVGATTREPTMEFVKALKKERPQVPVIVLSAVPDEALSAFLGAFDNTATVPFTASWRQELTRRSSDMMKGDAPEREEVLELDIKLERGQANLWTMERRGQNPFQTGGSLYIDSQQLNTVIDKSQLLEGQVDTRLWGVHLRDLSRELERLLFSAAPDNQRFWKCFVKHRERTGGIEHTRIRFTVTKDTYPILLEALKEEDEPDGFWMLMAPIFRRYDSTGRGYPLFKDVESRTGPINCLIIQADPEGGDVAGKEFANLEGVVGEVAEIEKLLKRKRKANGIGDVETVSVNAIKGDREDIVKALYAKLSSQRWHLVHFAGHVAKFSRDEIAAHPRESGLDGATSDVCAMVLSAGRRCVLDVANFVNKLPGTQFLFLSSCRSADSYVVMRAAEQYLPAVLGYRWKVADKGAKAFATAFYGELFDESDDSYKYIEYAFRDARKAIFEFDKNDPTWASPVLVMQLAQAQAA